MAKSPVLRIDIASIPDFRREELAKGALALTEQVFSMPGAEERYQAWLRRGQLGPPGNRKGLILWDAISM